MIRNNELGGNAPCLEATDSSGGNEYSRRLNVLTFFREGDSVHPATRCISRLQRADSTGTNPMDRADLYRVFELGGALHPVTTITHGDTLAKVFGIVSSARGALIQLLGAAPQAKVDICIHAATDLRK